MKSPRGGILPKLRPFIPRALLDGCWLDAVEDRIHGLPWGSILCYEFRLTDTTPAADIGFFVNSSEARDYYMARGRRAAHASPVAALGRFLERLDRSGPAADPALADAFDTMTIEYDIVAERSLDRRREPGIFLWLRREFVRKPGEIIDIIAAAVGWGDYREIVQAVERAWRALPEKLHWERQIAAMPGREPKAARLVAREMEAAEVPGMLEAVGWPGSIAKVEDALARLRGLTLTFKPALDIFANGVSPRLGLLVIYPGDRDADDYWLSTGREDWRPIMERMLAQGLCLPGKAQGLLEWPGRTQLFTNEGIATLYKGINHLKLVIDGDRVGAKAYCGLLYTPLPPKT